MKVWALTDGPVKEGKYLVVRRDGTIPKWPHFVIGGADPAARAALLAYAAEARRLQMDEDFCSSVEELADAFAMFGLQARQDTATLGTKGADPDAGPHRKDNPAIIAMMRGEADLSGYQVGDDGATIRG